MTYLRRASLLVLFLSGTFAMRAPAQANDFVPRELALALIGQWRGYIDYSALFVGRTPPGLPAALLPADATILGGLEFEETSTVVLTFPKAPAAAQQEVEEQLKANGWIAAPTRSQPKGFVGGSAFSPAMPLCNGDKVASIVASPRPTGGSLVTLSFTIYLRGGPCGPPEPRRSWQEDLPIPAMSPPPGMVNEGGGSSSSDNSWELRTQLRGRATAAEVLRHYANQLSAAGWTAGVSATGEGVAIQALQRTQTDGIAWQATLSVAAPIGTSSVDVMLQLRRQRNRGT